MLFPRFISSVRPSLNNDGLPVKLALSDETRMTFEPIFAVAALVSPSILNPVAVVLPMFSVSAMILLRPVLLMDMSPTPSPSPIVPPG